MAIFKCKICGGTLEIDGVQSVATCEYCGTKQTIPKLDDDRKANLYDRANHFRRNNDFDKAMGIFEIILNEDNTDAEAYWSIVLCRYGIEYVEDPTTHKRVPTVNRAQYTSIFDDEDYRSALTNADGYQREIYETEANAINEIQKGFLAISQKEEPFDVFICYKETDESGRRTHDSVLATELYHELTREGFKVFFSRITLEDKLGIAYEPYIFAALNSAKVMVVVGTRPEHFNAVWVKNEWSRYLALIKNGAKKTLIPAYRNMDPYDLPEEFSHLQAQDMSKLGFMQDMIRGIKKIIEADAPKATTKETVITTNVALNITPLLKRAFMFLEDGEFERADEFCEQVLNQDPENAEAYLGKLMVELRVKTPEQLKECELPFDNENYYRKAMRFADKTLSSQLRGYISHINERNNLRKLTALYNDCVLYMNSARSAVEYRNAAAQFNKIPGFKDADSLAQLCLAKANEIEEKEKAEAARKAEEKRIADEQARLRRQRQAELDRIEAKKRAERNKKIAKIVLPIVTAVILFVIVLNTLIIPNIKYNNAVTLMNDGKYEQAISIFESLDGYKDSDEKILNCKYEIAKALVEKGKYKEAIDLAQSLVGLENKQILVNTINAIIEIEDKKVEEGIKTLLEAGVPVELTYNAQGGSLSSNQSTITYTTLSAFVGLSEPIKDGYRFVEWELDSYTYNVNLGDAKFCLALKANWSAKDYTISYDLAGGKLEGANVSEYDSEDETFTLINPTRKGYTFAGWIGTDILEATLEVTIAKGTFGNRTYTATWTPNVNDVVFNSNGGSGTMESLKVATQASSMLPECIFTKAGYSFAGWSTANDNTVEYQNKTEYEMGVEESYILYAVWVANKNDIIFDANGGSGNMSNQQINTGVTENLIKNTFSKDGYYFVGWSTTPNGNVEYADQANYSMGTESTYTLYAIWAENTNRVVFNGNGHTSGAMSDQNIKTGNTANLNACTYEKTGYTFVGWSTTPTGNVELLNNATYTMGTNMVYTLYAVWSANTNTVVFNANTGNGSMSSIQIKTDATQALPVCTFTKEGYTFVGWATSPNGSKAYSDGGSYTMGTNNSYTLYAVWKVTEYNISYSLNGGTASNVGMYTINDRVVINNPSRDGYVFVGWTGTGITGSIMNFVIDTGSIGNKEFVANWESYLLYEDNGDGYTVTGVVEKYQSIGEIRIPSVYNGKPVTKISYLSECTSVKKLIIPNSVTMVESGAVKGFSGLESITLPFTGEKLDTPKDDRGNYTSSVYPFGWIFGTDEYVGGTSVVQYYYQWNSSYSASISYQTYYVPSNLTDVYITDKISGYRSFAECKMIKNVYIPDDTDTISEYTFAGCSALVNISNISGMSLSVKSIEQYAFSGCVSLTTHISARQVGYYSFSDCEKITAFTFLELPSDNFGNIDESTGPNYTESRVGAYAFSGCSNLSNIYVLDNVAKIEWRSHISDYSISTLNPSKLLNSSELAAYIKNLENQYIKCCAWF